MKLVFALLLVVLLGFAQGQQDDFNSFFGDELNADVSDQADLENAADNAIAPTTSSVAAKVAPTTVPATTTKAAAATTTTTSAAPVATTQALPAAAAASGTRPRTRRFGNTDMPAWSVALITIGAVALAGGISVALIGAIRMTETKGALNFVEAQYTVQKPADSNRPGLVFLIVGLICIVVGATSLGVGIGVPVSTLA